MSNIAALVGNPNSGKTTLFNGLTGGNVKTGNWPGVTVEKREGICRFNDKQAQIVDLPGIYSFSASSEDEVVARDYVLSSEPTIIVNIIDGNNLERNLYLTTQLIEMKVPILLVINMMDIAEKQGVLIDIDELEKLMGIPVVGISALKTDDIEKLKKRLFELMENPVLPKTTVEITQSYSADFKGALPGNEIEYPNELESVLSLWEQKFSKTAKELTLNARYLAVKTVEGDKWIQEKVISHGDITESEIQEAQNRIEKVLDDTPDIILADYRYGYIHGITKSVIKRPKQRIDITDTIDTVVLNRFLGVPIFFGVMYLVFWITIALGGAFIDFFDIFFSTIFVDGVGNLLTTIGIPRWITIILADGVGGGIQTVATFVPIIFMMFLVLAVLEDSGYMARAAFVMDRFMRYIGLPGKAFVPLLVGFGCTVPAIMGTRTLDNKRDRLLTMFMAPFMSCGARLPVYALFVAAFFPDNGGLIVFSLYLVGIFFAVFTGLLLKKTLFQGEASYFIMELPPYHPPRPRHILIHTWMRLRGFILRAGKVILLAVIVLSTLNSVGIDGSFGNQDSENSLLSAIGKTITPVFEPMGIEQENWPATVGIFTGIFSKESIVGTLNSLYSQMDASTGTQENETGPEEEFNFWGGIAESFQTIPQNLSGVFGGPGDPLGLGLVSETDKETLGEEIGADATTFGLMHSYFSKGKAQAYSYLIFVLLYFPCVAAFGAVIKEAGPFLGTLNAVYLTVLAWIVSTLFYQITVAHNAIWIVVALALLALQILYFYFLGRQGKYKEA
jgi:ferrous iron transport protein B